MQVTFLAKIEHWILPMWIHETSGVRIRDCWTDHSGECLSNLGIACDMLYHICMSPASVPVEIAWQIWLAVFTIMNKKSHSPGYAYSHHVGYAGCASGKTPCFELACTWWPLFESYWLPISQWPPFLKCSIPIECAPSTAHRCLLNTASATECLQQVRIFFFHL